MCNCRATFSHLFVSIFQRQQQQQQQSHPPQLNHNKCTVQTRIRLVDQAGDTEVRYCPGSDGGVRMWCWCGEIPVIDAWESWDNKEWSQHRSDLVDWVSVKLEMLQWYMKCRIISYLLKNKNYHDSLIFQRMLGWHELSKSSPVESSYQKQLNKTVWSDSRKCD